VNVLHADVLSTQMLEERIRDNDNGGIDEWCLVSALSVPEDQEISKSAGETLSLFSASPQLS
jgi:hypothetical protein